MKSSAISNGAIGASTQYNALRDDARGGGSLLAHNQLGILALPTNPSNTQTWTLTINGTAISGAFVSSIGSTAGNVLIGASASVTIQNLLNLFQNPQQTNANQVALSLPNQQLLSYVGYALNGTNLTIYSFNTLTNPQLTSFTASTTATGGSWTAGTMKLYVESGLFYIGITQVVFSGNNSPAFTAPISNPRIDILTLDSSGTLAITQGTENASPVAPTYPTGKVVLCEVYNVVSETKILDNANQSASQGYISKDARGFQSVFYIGDNSQIAAGVIQQSNLANAGTIQTGSLVIHSARTAPAGFLICDGSGVSRSTYATLFSTIVPSIGTFTVTLATPAVFTLNSHGFIAGDSIYFTTTGALPTGLSANTIYYVISAGLTTNAFEVSATRGGSAINTSGSQSGTHTCFHCPWGLGDGSTTFNVPDMRANVPMGFKSGDANASNLGITGGEATHTLTASEIPAHTHSYSISNGAGGGSGSATAGPTNGTANTGNGTGGGGAHNNVQPFATILYIIKT